MVKCILCKNNFKVCEILVYKDKDFYQLSFGINLVRSPDATEIRKGGRAACNLSLHFDIIPNPLEFSILLCGGVCHKLQTYNCEKIIQEWKKHSNFKN